MNINLALSEIKTILSDMKDQSLTKRIMSKELIEKYYDELRNYAAKNQAAPGTINMKIVDLTCACEALVKVDKPIKKSDSDYVVEGLAAVDGMKRVFDQNARAIAA